MDQDKIFDIVTNDIKGDIKVFYGGNTNGRGNYVSKLSYACDNQRRSRQVRDTKLVKSF